MAQRRESDVDLLTIGLPSARANEMADALSRRFSVVCRAVEVAAARLADFTGGSDAAYGGRVFLRHYCVHIAGPDHHSALPEFAADARAARGFNGDIAEHSRRWRLELEKGGNPVDLSRRLARKCLLAVAGPVSVHDDTWTTDRTTAAARWAEIEPAVAQDLQMLLAWSAGDSSADRESVAAALDGVVERVVNAFRTSIGLWESGG
jgi:hypothetical protein